jgi:hypothetical protein
MGVAPGLKVGACVALLGRAAKTREMPEIDRINYDIGLVLQENGRCACNESLTRM